MADILFQIWENIKFIFIIFYIYVGIFILLCWPAVLAGFIGGVFYLITSKLITLKNIRKKNNG